MPLGEWKTKNKIDPIMASRNSAAGTLLALVAGTVIGVLIAPASGRETRRRLMERGEGAKDTLHYLVMEAGDLFDQLRSFLGDLGQQGSHLGDLDQSRSTRREPTYPSRN